MKFYTRFFGTIMVLNANWQYREFTTQQTWRRRCCVRFSLRLGCVIIACLHHSITSAINGLFWNACTKPPCMPVALPSNCQNVCQLMHEAERCSIISAASSLLGENVCNLLQKHVVVNPILQSSNLIGRSKSIQQPPAGIPKKSAGVRQK